MQLDRKTVRYFDLQFDADFLSATRDNGQRLRFTRHERALLATLAGRPGRLFSREQLLQAMSAEPEDLNDRNVDFVINRLRKKLGDPARTPRFIATQYGEGYVWVAAERSVGRDGFLVIGPLRGLAATGARSEMIEDALRRLHGQIAARCAVGQEIAFLPAWSREASSDYRYSVSADFILERNRLEAAFALRNERDRRVVRVIRCEMTEAMLDHQLRELASNVIGAVWRDLVLAPGAELDPVGPPLEIRMQEAAMTLSNEVDQGWRYIAERLAEEETKTPGDPQIAVMRATYLYAQMLLGISFEADVAAYRRLEMEIERLVLAALPEVRSDPILRLAAAKLLFVVDSRHLPLVEELVGESLSGSAFAAALSQRGSIESYRGELDAALATYEQALTFCPQGSEFQIYLLVKKSCVLLAQDDWAGAHAVYRQILRIKPQAALALFYLPPHDQPLDKEMRVALDRLTREGARRLIGHQLFMFARYFANPEHGLNVMAGAMRHLGPRFGSAILPNEALKGASELLRLLQERADAAQARSPQA